MAPASFSGRGARVCRRPISRILSRTIIPLGDALLRRSSNLPGGFSAHLFRWRPAWARRARHALAAVGQAANSLPIWSCSVWGLPCPRLYSRRGALLPHLFTLTRRFWRLAVYFLWHWPSSGLEAGIPDVIRHTALRSSDFPLPKCFHTSAATAQLACKLYFSSDSTNTSPIRALHFDFNEQAASNSL